jgi:pyruvate ferredoxin oxidoreductase delta subunit
MSKYDVVMGAVIPKLRSSVENKTGGWRTKRPVIDVEKCVNCLICWIYCPDASIIRLEKYVTVNYDYCKGCGICAEECPRKAITMVEEG